MSADVIAFPTRHNPIVFEAGQRVIDRKDGAAGRIEAFLANRAGHFVFATLRMEGGRGRRVIEISNMEAAAC